MEVLLSREMTTRETVEKETKGTCADEDCVDGSGLRISLLHSFPCAVGLFLCDLEGLSFQELPLFVS